LATADVLIGHNIIRYDLPVLEKVCGFKVRPEVELLDTMILARLIFPNVRETDALLVVQNKMPRCSASDPTKSLIGRHTLEAWGYRLGERKSHFEGTWETWTQAMQDYMVQDVATNLALWRHLRPDNYSRPAIVLEHRIARLCDAIETNGIPFDQEAAGALHAELVGKKHTLEQALVGQFGSWLAPISPTKYLFTPKKDNAKRGYVAGQQCCKLKVVEFNPGSRDNIIKVLKDRGWNPTVFTDAGKPKVDEAIVASLVVQFPEATGLAEYLMVDKRLSQLAEGEQAWLKHVSAVDGHVHGVVNPMGTITSRATHFNPNISQVPSPKKPYGIACRGLFGRKSGWSLVGADQDGLELRGLAHYLAKDDGGAYGRIVTSGDPHWANLLAMGLLPAGTLRDKHNQLHTVLREDGSKRFIYAYVYGCWDDMAGQIILRCLNNARATCGAEGKAIYEQVFGKAKPTEKLIRSVGKRVRANFAKRIDGFTALNERIGTQVDRFGWVPGLDGRRIPSRSKHSALNFLIQSAGAILCKRWGCDAYDELSTKYKMGWNGEVAFIIWNHDEYQVACREGLEEDVGQILVKHARNAGQDYGFRVPLDSKFTVGRTWADTH
jgi:DNA polymerase I-like protein with 3'-5' exonuclease and polymerase domains